MGYLNDYTYRAYDYLGCHKAGKNYVFRVWAPNAQAVSVVGDFNYWDASAAPMTRDWEGYWTAELAGVEKGQVYKYAVVGPDGRQVLQGLGPGRLQVGRQGLDEGPAQDEPPRRAHEHLRDAHWLLASERGGGLPQL